MTGTIEVLHLCNEVGLGGTERGIASMCRLMDFGVFRHTVLCLSKAGARAADLEGFARLHVADGNARALDELLAGKRFQVALVHRSGRSEPRWSRAISLCAAHGVAAIIEVNVFGEVDTSEADAAIDCHLHISKSSYCNFRAAAAARGYERLDRHRVMYIPTDVAGFPGVLPADARRALKARFGLGPDDFVLLRTGRPDARKWGDLLLDVIPLVTRRIADARFVFLSAPRTRAWYMSRRFFADRVRVLPATSDDLVLEDAYRMADVYVHASRRGESLGVSLIEAMAAQLPVVVDSTPWRDNAQVEVVDHMETGIVANSAQGFANAIQLLHRDPDLRAALGRRGRKKALRTYDAAVVCASLAHLVGETLRRKGVPHPDAAVLRGPVEPSAEEIERYWAVEKAQRERRSWAEEKPRRFSSPLRRAAWLIVDAFEVAAHKSGII